MSGTCIAKKGGRICGAPTSDHGRGILCDMHLLLHQSGSRVELAKSARDDQRKTFRLLKGSRDGTGAALLSPQAVMVFAFTATLFLLEILRMSVLQVPMSISMVGFDTLSAAVRNAGPAFVILAGCMISLAAVIALSASAILLFYIGYLSSIVVEAVARLGLVRFVFGLLITPANLSIFWFGFRGDKRRVSRERAWLETAFPALRHKRGRARNRLAARQKQARKSLREKCDATVSALGWFWHTLTSLRHKGITANATRFTVAAGAVVMTVWASWLITTKYNDRLQVASLMGLEGTACGNPQSGKGWRAPLMALRESLFAPCPETGRLTIATRVPYDAVHLRGDARLDSTTGTGFRTEDVFYIGDFGEWAFVARMADASQRLLIRRGAILEFAQFDSTKRATPSDPDQPLQELTRAVDGLRDRTEARFGMLNKRIDGHLQWAGGDTHIPDAGHAMQHGVPVRAVGITEDLARRFGQGFLAACAVEGNRTGLFDFAEGRAEREPDGRLEQIAERTAGRLQRMPRGTAAVMVLRGGASYTGSPENNIRLSERRAEWSQQKLLAALEKRARTIPEHGDILSRKIDLVAFGVGERLDHAQGTSRSVEVFLCPAPPLDQPVVSAQFQGVDPVAISHEEKQPGSDF